ncbi:ComEC/Rec2 family competence protein [Vibrio metschnikovii]
MELRNSGLIHLTAISGLHIGMAFGLAICWGKYVLCRLLKELIATFCLRLNCLHSVMLGDSRFYATDSASIDDVLVKYSVSHV